MSGSNGTDWVFAYGSNMDLADLKRWFKEKGFSDAEVSSAETCILPGYQLVWNYYSTSRGAGAANVERCNGRELPGLVLRINKRGLEAIDRKEGHPSFYDRGAKREQVKLPDGRTLDAWVYVARASRTKQEVVPPKRYYVQFMIDAAKRHNFPDWYIAELEATPVVD